MSTTTKTNVCKECGKSIGTSAVRCITCSNKHRAKPPKLCIICGKKIHHQADKYCLSCWNKVQDQGKSRERTKFANSAGWKKVRTQCFKDHDYRCVMCQTRGCYIEAHHVKAWATHPEDRLDIANLIVLCRPCHKLIHWGRKDD